MTERVDIAAIVTAAGASSRMGRPKALLPWGDVPLVAHQVEMLARFGVRSVVVLGARAHDIAPWVPAEATIVHNEAWADGRSGSIEAGAAAVADGVRCIVMVAVDQPLEDTLLSRLLAAPSAPLVEPLSESGRRGHPIVLHGASLGRLRRVSTLPLGLKTLVRTLRPDGLQIRIPGWMPLDLNEPADYLRAARCAVSG